MKINTNLKIHAPAQQLALTAQKKRTAGIHTSTADSENVCADQYEFENPRRNPEI